MQKTLLKFLAFELVERVARFDGLLLSVANSTEPPAPALLAGLEARLDALKDRILGEKKFLLRVFDEKSLKDQSFQANLPRKLTEAIYGPYTELCELSRWLPRVYHRPLLPETAIFLRDSIPGELAARVGRRAVVFEPEGESNAPENGFEGVFIEPLSYLQRNNPLGWLGLGRAFGHEMARSGPVIQSLEKTRKGLLLDEAFLATLMRDALSLRLMGPGYYYYAVAEALIRRDFVFLEKIEPALFYGLNYFNYVDKSLVILHEAAEKSREVFEFNGNGANAQDRLLHKDQMALVLATVEKLVPEKFAFSERQFRRALSLQDRLGQGIMLGAAGVYPLDEVEERLACSLSGGEESGAIYDLLGLVGEVPNTSREIVNAGWVHKLERSPVWLYDTLDGSGGTGEGFDRLLELLDARDHLLLKSVETSEVHRVLLTTA